MHGDSTTRERVLEAAGEIFADLGFRSATVRKICEKARVNVSSIKYYFGSKEELYQAVLAHWNEFAIQKYPLLLDVGNEASAEDQLRAFIRSLLFRILDKGKPAWFGKLMAREMAEPTRIFDRMLEDIMRQRTELLASIIRKIVGVNADEETIRLFCASILSQCFHYYNVRVSRMLVERDMTNRREIERIADHIMRFSLKGFEHYFDLKIVRMKVSGT